MKRREKASLFLVTIAALLGGEVAEANANTTAAHQLMQQLDVNKDGVISLKEAVRHTELLRNFGLIDDNEDGKLTETELAKSKLTPGNTIPKKAGN